jgi:hypothetical protein
MSEVDAQQNVSSIGSSSGNASAPEMGANSGLVNLLTKSNPEKAIGDVIDQLVVDRETWEKTDLARSNERLYALLQNCYALHNTMVGSDALAKALRKGLSNYIEFRKYPFSDSTPLMTKIVKCVFGVDRRRVHSYATALLAAKERRIAVIELPRWLKDQGGVEEVRRTAKSGSTSMAKRVDDGKMVLQSEVLAVVQSDKLNAQFSTEKLQEGVVLLATRSDDGSFAIRKVIQADSVIKAAIASCSALGKQAKKKQQMEADAKAAEAARLAAQKELKVA